MTIPADFVQANTMMLQAYAALSVSAETETEQALVEQLTGILAGAVPPERVSHFFEFGYAHRSELPAELLPAIADVGNFAWTMGFYGLGLENRGALMEWLLRGQSLPEGVTAPEPMAAFAPAVPA